MKVIKLLAVIAASFVINACPVWIDIFPDDDDYGTSKVQLIVENKTNIPFYLSILSEGISGRVYAKQVCTLVKDRKGSIPGVNFSGYIDFYYIVDDDKPFMSEDKLIKSISNAASVVTLVADNRDKNYVGKVVYKLIVTNEMLGITANTGGGVQVEGEDNAGGEDDAEILEASAENGGEA
jgi:hypothetical protein